MKNLIILLLCCSIFQLPLQAEDKVANAKARLKGYIDTMMEGKRAMILEVKDYYSTIYLTKDYKITEFTPLSIESKDDGFKAVIEFNVQSRINQDAEQTPASIKEVKEPEKVVKTVGFKPGEKNMMWVRKLEFPFVKKEKTQRYILKKD